MYLKKLLCLPKICRRTDKFQHAFLIFVQILKYGTWLKAITAFKFIYLLYTKEIKMCINEREIRSGKSKGVYEETMILITSGPPLQYLFAIKHHVINMSNITLHVTVELI